MKRIFIFLSLFLIFFSCKESSKKSSKTIDNISFEELRVEKKIFFQNDSTRPYMKINLNFKYPVKALNDTILQRMQNVFVRAFAGEKYIGRSPQGAFEAYENNLTEEGKKLAAAMWDNLSLYAECYEEVKTDVIDTSSYIITIKTEMFNYTGGAHGAYSLSYYNIDTGTGELITEKELFNNYQETKITGIIKQSMFTKYGEGWKDMVFDENDVKPNGNFYISDEGILYVYNHYEIAPYAVGIIEVLLPYSSLEGIIAKKYIRKQDV